MTHLNRILACLLSLVGVGTTVFATAFASVLMGLPDELPKGADPAGTISYFLTPEHVSVGDDRPPAEVEQSLRDAGYTPSASHAPGTFDAQTGTMQVVLRSSPPRSVHVRWTGAKIASISNGGRAVTEWLIVGPPIASVLNRSSAPELLNVEAGRVVISDVVGSQFVDALLSSEDHRFETHGGLSLFQTTTGVLQHRGGSTLTQQLARSCIMRDQSRTVARKVREILTAVAVEARFTKADILESYVNCVYFGSDAAATQLYGSDAAARRLFLAQSTRTLTLADAATAAAILNAPSVHIAAVRKGATGQLQARRDRVLRLMRRNYADRYSEAVINAAIAQPLQLPGLASSSSDRTRRATARQLIEMQWRLDGRPAVDARRVYLTVDPRVQSAAAAALDEGISRLENQHHLVDGSLQGALIAMRSDGRIVAVVGGRREAGGTFNRAFQARRSPGSLVKPFVQLAALAAASLKGAAITPATLINPSSLDSGYRPHHCGDADRDRVMLARSDNCAAIIVGRAVGLTSAAEILHAAFGREPEKSLPMLIGGARGSEVTPLEVASAYSTFVNNGQRAVPRLTEAVDVGGSLTINPPTLSRVAGEAETFVVLQMLRSVVGDSLPIAGATAGRAKIMTGLGPQFQLAGKTGTGQVSDLWFVSISPQLVIVTWIGSDGNEPLRLSHGWVGATAALPIWASFVSKTMADSPSLFTGEFRRPSGVVSATIDPRSGCLAAFGIVEFFVEGRIPAPCVR